MPPLMRARPPLTSARAAPELARPPVASQRTKVQPKTKAGLAATAVAAVGPRARRARAAARWVQTAAAAGRR